MLVNADFSRRVTLEPAQHRWVASPQPGVERVMLDRLGEEKARATSLVRYAAGSSFPFHHHPGGEEILVLSGAFSEGHDHYPAGWYLRSPPGSGHQPYSREGALIFVKLWQMAPDEHEAVRLDTHDPQRWTTQDGRAVCALFEGPHERTRLERAAPGTTLLPLRVQGAELLVIEGEVCAGTQCLASGSWIRLPPGQYPVFRAGSTGATVYLKTGHLPPAAAPRP